MLTSNCRPETRPAATLALVTPWFINDMLLPGAEHWRGGGMGDGDEFGAQALAHLRGLAFAGAGSDA
ncbi:hypothetical protein DK847_18690 [Aestuariivirga litoralis]|uniref:Uncharacterized protein n=1 Tax=Aestuariivirga litoralis TaxID=2650924 RepID=A0A2W2B5G3_9HYPH|nr:hypothetical protein DK847_18690 [Aestuariivirga litoralis]